MEQHALKPLMANIAVNVLQDLKALIAKSTSTNVYFNRASMAVFALKRPTVLRKNLVFSIVPVAIILDTVAFCAMNVNLVVVEMFGVGVPSVRNRNSMLLLLPQHLVLTRNVLQDMALRVIIGTSWAIIVKNALTGKNLQQDQVFVPISMNVTQIPAKTEQRALNHRQATPFHWANINVRVALVFQVTIVRSTINVYQIPVVLTV
jgi:hypothetical protein